MGPRLPCSHYHAVAWGGRHLPPDSAGSPTASGRPAGQTWSPGPSCILSVSESLSISPSLGLDGVMLPGRYKPTRQAELGPPLLQGSHAPCSIISANGRSVAFHQPEPVLERETETQTVRGWSGPRAWGWMGVGAGGLHHPKTGRRDGRALPSETPSAPRQLWAAHPALSRKTRSAR